MVLWKPRTLNTSGFSGFKQTSPLLQGTSDQIRGTLMSAIFFVAFRCCYILHPGSLQPIKSFQIRAVKKEFPLLWVIFKRYEQWFKNKYIASLSEYQVYHPSIQSIPPSVHLSTPPTLHPNKRMQEEGYCCYKQLSPRLPGCYNALINRPLLFGVWLVGRLRRYTHQADRNSTQHQEKMPSHGGCVSGKSTALKNSTNVDL